MKIFLTKDQIVKIYTGTFAGLSYYSIAKNMSVPISTVRNSLRYLEKYLNGTARGRIITNYVEAAKEIYDLKKPQPKNTMKKYLSKDQILQCYKLHKEQHISLEKVSQTLGLAFGTVGATIHRLKKYLNEESFPKNRNINPAYKEVVDILKNEGVKTTYVSTTDVKINNSDPFEKLNEAYKKFNDAIGMFVEEMMNKRAEGILTELKAQREANKELVEAIEQAKNVNWITSLKNKFS